MKTLERRELLASDLALTAFADGTASDYIDQNKVSGSVDAGAPGIWTNPVGSSFNPAEPSTVTWSIVPDGTLDSSSGDTSNLIAFMDAIYGTANGAVENRPWFPLFQQAYDRWSEVSGINFVYESSDDMAPLDQANRGEAGTRGDIRIAGRDIDGNFNSLALNYAPSDGGNSGLDGDMIIDTNDAWFVVNAEPSDAENRFLVNLLTQQAGHGLGLGHRIPTNGEKLMEFTVTDGISGPQHDDILAVQGLYGDVDEPNESASPTTATSLGQLGNGLTRIQGNSIRTGDTDVYQFSIPSGGTLQRLTLTPLGESYDVADDGATVSSVDTSTNQNLRFRVLDSTGAQLAAVDATGSGASEELSNLVLPTDGTYYIEIAGTGTEVQLYEVGILLRDISPNAAAGPTLLSVAPNVGEIFSFNRTNDLNEAPNELTFRFDTTLSADSLQSIKIVRSGDDRDFSDGDEVTVTPGWIGFSDPDPTTGLGRIIKARFATPLEDDLYRVEVFGVDVAGEGIEAAEDEAGLALEPRIDGTDRDTVFFQLELGALVNAVVPQPVTSNADGSVSQALDQVVVYFNSDDLHPVAVTSTGSPSDPTVVRPEF